MISKYYKMDPSDPASVRLVQFPSNAEALGTDADGNIVEASICAVKVNASDPTAGYLEDKLADTVDIEFNPTADNSQLESIIYQITGKGAGLVKVDTPFQFNVSSHNGGGRGVSSGRQYVSGVELKCWATLGEAGDIYWTRDDWKTVTSDSNFVSSGKLQRPGCIHFIYLSFASSFAWVIGQGNSAFIYALHTSSNYNSDGTIKSTAWTTLSFSVSNVGNSGDFSSGPDNVVCFVGDSRGIGRTTDFSTFSSVGLCDYTTGGIDTDRYGNWLVIERDTGVLWQSTDNGITWTKVTSIFVNDSASSALPVNNGEQWGSIQSSYGLWIAAVWNVSTTRISYAYSEDRLHWYTFKDESNPAAFYSAGTDGVKWYATNPNANTSPAIYQLLVNNIPVHRRLICEKGMAVSGDAFLLDVPNATSIGTDVNGKIVAKFDNTSTSKKYYSSNPDVVRGDSSNIMAVSASFNDIDTSGWLTNEIVELDFHLMMVPLEINGSLTSGGRAVVNLSGQPRQVFFLFENTTLNTAGIFQIQGLMNDRPSASSILDTTSPRPYRITLEIEKNGNVLSVRGGTVSIPYYVSGTTMIEGILSYGFTYSNTGNVIFHPDAVPGSELKGEFDHLTIGLNLNWLGELALTGCANFSSAFVADTSLTATLEVNRIKKGA